MLSEMKSRLAGKNKIEIFTGGCSYCISAVDLVNSLADKDDEVTVYNLNEIGTKENYKKIADSYEIKSVPAVVVNGKLLECCKSQGITKEILLAALN